jgi:hypothetical protein
MTWYNTDGILRVPKQGPSSAFEALSQFTTGIFSPPRTLKLITQAVPYKGIRHEILPSYKYIIYYIIYAISIYIPNSY